MSPVTLSISLNSSVSKCYNLASLLKLLALSDLWVNPLGLDNLPTLTIASVG